MTKSRDKFPIQTRDRKGSSVPWAAVAAYEVRAQKNHGQTLGRLAERAGLGWNELLWLITDTPYQTGRGSPEEDCRAAVMTLLKERKIV